MKRFSILILLVLSVISCNKKKWFDGPDTYSDDFDSYSEIESLISEGNEHWSLFQLSFDENQVSLDSMITHSGNQSFKAVALASTDSGGASKASIMKQKMAFWEKEVVYLSAWYYLVGDQSEEWLFLMDLEERAAISAGPGMRLALVGDALRVEHKYKNKDIIQATASQLVFPRNEWVHVEMEVKLSQKKKGYVKVWQNGTLILNQDNWKTLPSDFLYSQQGTKGMYSSVEFGITANSHDHSTVLYVDDIVVKRLD